MFQKRRPNSAILLIKNEITKDIDFEDFMEDFVFIQKKLTLNNVFKMFVNDCIVNMHLYKCCNHFNYTI